jgi:hypothetical protein
MAAICSPLTGETAGGNDMAKTIAADISTRRLVRAPSDISRSTFAR